MVLRDKQPDPKVP